MPKFIVAYASLFDNEMHIEVVEADTPAGAVYASGVLKAWAEEDMEAWWEKHKEASVEKLSDFFFDCDLILGVKELT